MLKSAWFSESKVLFFCAKKIHSLFFSPDKKKGKIGTFLHCVFKKWGRLVEKLIIYKLLGFLCPFCGGVPPHPLRILAERGDPPRPPRIFLGGWWGVALQRFWGGAGANPHTWFEKIDSGGAPCFFFSVRARRKRRGRRENEKTGGKKEKRSGKSKIRLRRTANVHGQNRKHSETAYTPTSRSSWCKKMQSDLSTTKKKGGLFTKSVILTNPKRNVDGPRTPPFPAPPHDHGRPANWAPSSSNMPHGKTNRWPKPPALQPSSAQS